MNERLWELAEQSVVAMDIETRADRRKAERIDIKKFAELIVRECMSMCDEQRAHYFGHRMASDDFIDKNMYAEGEAACDILHYKMKTHFGVEE